MVKYYASAWGRPSIRQVDVIEETKKFVVLHENIFGEPAKRRRAKIAEKDGYFDTFDEAKSFLVEYCQGQVDHQKHHLSLMIGKLQEAESLSA